MKRFALAAVILLLSTQTALAGLEVEYQVTVSKPQTHIFEVCVYVNNIEENHIDVSFPVWSTGMYVVQDFAANIMQFRAFGADGTALSVIRTDKNTWRVMLNGGKSARITYEMFAQSTHSTYSFLNDHAGHLLCNSVLPFIEGAVDLPTKLTLALPENWKVSCGAIPDEDNPLAFTMPDYHVLADSNFLLGQLEKRHFEVDGVPHEVAVAGQTDLDIDAFANACKKFVEAARGLMGQLPYKKYSFLLYLGDRHGGGLEHACGTTIVSERWGYSTSRGFNSLVNLACHEYFHLWNVKRIKPPQFSPYDYDKENTTGFLWFNEGITEYYTNQILLRAGLITTRDSLNNLQNLINEMVNTPGRLERSVWDASFDAYVSQKIARENSINTFYSYYPRGEIAGNIIDLEIISRTGGEKSLDDVLLLMWEGAQQGKTFTTEDVRGLCERVAGGSFEGVFNDYVYGVKEVPFDAYLELAGLELIADEEATTATQVGGYIGIQCREINGALVVAGALRGSNAWLSGISGSDEILAMDNVRIKSKRDYDYQLTLKKPGDKVNLLVGREGLVIPLEITLEEYPNPVYIIREIPDAGALQKKIFSKWQERR